MLTILLGYVKINHSPENFMNLQLHLRIIGKSHSASIPYIPGSHMYILIS